MCQQPQLRAHTHAAQESPAVHPRGQALAPVLSPRSSALSMTAGCAAEGESCSNDASCCSAAPFCAYSNPATSTATVCEWARDVMARQSEAEALRSVCGARQQGPQQKTCLLSSLWLRSSQVQQAVIRSRAWSLRTAFPVDVVAIVHLQLEVETYAAPTVSAGFAGRGLASGLGTQRQKRHVTLSGRPPPCPC